MVNVISSLAVMTYQNGQKLSQSPTRILGRSQSLFITILSVDTAFRSNSPWMVVPRTKVSLRSFATGMESAEFNHQHIIHRATVWSSAAIHLSLIA